MWGTLHVGHLPDRCTPKWYFDTFCGGGREHSSLFGKNTDIRTFLHGDVKTYDVLAAIHTVRKTHSTEHYQVTLLTTEEHMIPSYIVQNSLKTAYYWVLTRSN